MSFFSTPPEVSIQVNSPRGTHNRRGKDDTAALPSVQEHCPIFMDQDKVQGQVIIKNRNAPTPMDHLGVFIEFVGKMERVDESSTCPSEFISIKLQLVPPSESPFMGEVLTCPFDFGPMKFQFASYEGVAVAIRYGLRVSFGKRPNDCFGGLMIWCPDSNVHDSGEEETETFLAASPATHDLGLEGALRIQIFVENTR